MKDMQNTRVYLKVFLRVVAHTKSKGEQILGGVAYRFNSIYATKYYILKGMKFIKRTCFDI